MASGIEFGLRKWMRHGRRVNQGQDTWRQCSGCKKQSQPNWESSQEVHMKEPRKTQNSCGKIYEGKRHQIVLLCYEWIMRCLKSYTQKMTNSEEANSVKCFHGHFINLKGNAPSVIREHWELKRAQVPYFSHCEGVQYAAVLFLGKSELLAPVAQVILCITR